MTAHIPKRERDLLRIAQAVERYRLSLVEQRAVNARVVRCIRVLGARNIQIARGRTKARKLALVLAKSALRAAREAQALTDLESIRSHKRLDALLLTFSDRK